MAEEPQAALPPGFSEVAAEAGIPSGFSLVDEEQVEPAAKPLVGFAGVESPSAALELGGEFAETLRTRREIKQKHITNILGPAYDPDGTFDGSFLAQVDMSRSTSLSDKQRKFRAAYPDGDLVSVPTPGGAVLLGRQNRQNPFVEIGLAPSIVGGLVSEPMVAGVAGSLLFGPVGTFAATTLAARGQTEVERARGFGEGGAGWSEALQEGILAGGLEAGMKGLSRAVLGRARTVAQQEAAMRSVLASSELGLEPLVVGQTAGPFGRGLFRQVAATSSTPEKVVTAQELSLYKAVKEMADEGFSETSDDVLSGVVREQQAHLNGLVSPSGLGRVDIGEVLQRGLSLYKKTSKELADRAYQAARDAGGDVIFDISPAKVVASDIKTGVLGAAEAGGVVKVSGGLPTELSVVVDDILKLDQRVAKFASDGGTEFAAFDQIKTLRTRLFDLKHSEDPSVRREANRLWQSLKDVMDHPVSGNPEFTSAYQKASALWALREDTLEKSFVAQALKSDTPEAVARKFMNPNNATALATIRDLIPESSFAQFRAGFASDVAGAATAQQGLARLRNFKALDPEGLGILLNPNEERELVKFLSTKARYESSPVRAMLDKTMTEGERFVAMAKSGSVGEVADAVQKAGGLSSDYAKMARAGVYKSILDEATTINPQGVQVVDAGKLLSSIDRWRKSGKLDAVFSDADWRKIGLFQAYAAPLSETADIGGGMMAGSLRQKAVDVPFSTLTGRFEQILGTVVRPLWSNSMTAWILSRPTSYLRLSAGGGKRPPLSEMAAAAVLASQEIDKTTSVPLEGVR